MEYELKLISVEEKTSKGGRKYHSFETNNGKMTCFEEKVVKELLQHIGDIILVDVEESKGFKNIKKYNSVVLANQTPQPVVPTAQAQPQPIVAQALAMEKPIKISLSQSAKGFTYISEVTIRVDTIDEAKDLLDKAMQLAECKVAELNMEPPAEVENESTAIRNG